MKNILLVFTGGTIGSNCHNGTIDTSSQARYQLLELFKQYYPTSDEIHFKILQPFQLLSENLQPSIWEQLIDAIEAEHPAEFDGIIVTHGTDTLAFSAAALALYFNYLNIPLLLVSSNYPMWHKSANGLDNFICAVEYIAQAKPAGVFVPYKNPGQIQHLHIASRLASCLQLSGDFISVQSRPYMLFENGNFTEYYVIDRASCIHRPLNPDFSSNILLLKPYPGLDYSHINLTGVDAVLHDLYHSGTACSSDQYGSQHALPAFINNCRQLGIKVYLAPALQHPDAYKSTRELIGLGAEMIWNMSLEAAYVKLLLGYGNFKQPQDISEFLQQDIALEHV
ncbi:asparaginase domain-containing protein [Methylomarinum sp. Ch1-1]|uniref:Asparaginase domain-containing protein n=1 Tax=Methylomarinum roseum TaxID=3067653 RepID=A0AAU7NW37_9GAMM|nr:asparaginase domain-containing protein [Methylomarinum sp. Ch1-1]MDP4522738.1 asparaginase domain-containing protein [Methylomarinum sp. Ch1-1]